MTDAERRTLNALRDLTADGWTASVRDVARHAGLASWASTHDRLVSLESRGLVERHPRNPKLGWRVIQRPPFLGPDG